MNPPLKSSEKGSSRRQFLGIAMEGVAASLATKIGFLDPTVVHAQANLSPDAALKELTAGNRRFSSGHPTAHQHDLAILKQKNADKQEPFAAVLACSDSRVPVEMIFDQSIGHIFVARVAGNFVTSEIMASLEYGAAILGVKVILVMGHSGCGAVKATIEGKKAPGQISALYPHIQPAVEKAGRDPETVTRVNAQLQAGLLRDASPVLSGLIQEQKLKVVAAHYDIGSGKVALL